MVPAASGLSRRQRERVGRQPGAHDAVPATIRSQGCRRPRQPAGWRCRRPELQTDSVRPAGSRTSGAPRRRSRTATPGRNAATAGDLPRPHRRPGPVGRSAAAACCHPVGRVARPPGSATLASHACSSRTRAHQGRPGSRCPRTARRCLAPDAPRGPARSVPPPAPAGSPSPSASGGPELDGAAATRAGPRQRAGRVGSDGVAARLRQPPDVWPRRSSTRDRVPAALSSIRSANAPMAGGQRRQRPRGPDGCRGDGGTNASTAVTSSAPATAARGMEAAHHPA